jgi:integrase/recombinase XerD
MSSICLIPVFCSVTCHGPMLAAVKSLLTFGADLRYLPFNVGRALKPEHSPNVLAERILSEEQALAMITLTSKPRDKMLIRLAYVTGVRVSEIVVLKWRNVQSSPVGGQVALYGKGGKTRVVAIRAETFEQLSALRGEAGPDDPVFLSQKGGQLDVSQAWRIIRAAGVPTVSPHWLRHSHASHALWLGASTATVRDTLGHSSLTVTSKYLHAKPGESSAHYLPA